MKHSKTKLIKGELLISNAKIWFSLEATHGFLQKVDFQNKYKIFVTILTEIMQEHIEFQ